MMKRTLILGYGNANRQDDGAAWHVMNSLARSFGHPVSASPEDGYQLEGCNPDFLFLLQLTPELSEVIQAFERVCFIDAHTGSVPGEVNQVEVGCEFQASPFTHHVTAATCLALTHALYGKCPQAILVSVRGYEFGFTTALSGFTSCLVDEAASKILAWLKQPEGRVN